MAMAGHPDTDKYLLACNKIVLRSFYSEVKFICLMLKDQSSFRLYTEKSNTFMHCLGSLLI